MGHMFLAVSFSQLSTGILMFYIVIPGQCPEPARGEPVSGCSLKLVERWDRFHLGLKWYQGTEPQELEFRKEIRNEKKKKTGHPLFRNTELGLSMG